MECLLPSQVGLAGCQWVIPTLQALYFACFLTLKVMARFSSNRDVLCSRNPRPLWLARFELFWKGQEGWTQRKLSFLLSVSRCYRDCFRDTCTWVPAAYLLNYLVHQVAKQTYTKSLLCAIYQVPCWKLENQRGERPRPCPRGAPRLGHVNKKAPALLGPQGPHMRRVWGLRALSHSVVESKPRIHAQLGTRKGARGRAHNFKPSLCIESILFESKWICQVGFIIPMLHLRKWGFRRLTVESPGILRKCGSWFGGPQVGSAMLRFSAAPGGRCLCCGSLHVTLRSHSEKTLRELWGLNRAEKARVSILLKIQRELDWPPIPTSCLKGSPFESFSIPLLLSSGKGAEKALGVLRKGG